MNYKKIDNYFFGFTQLNILNVYSNCPEFFNNFHLLITCLDSNLEVVGLVKWMSLIRSKHWDYKVINKSLLIDAKHLDEIMADGKTFSHFDEVYFVQEYSEKLNIHIDKTFTTDGYNFGENIPNDFINKFKQVGAIRYLSDGCGLNFGCDSIELVHKLEKVEKEINKLQ